MVALTLPQHCADNAIICIFFARLCQRRDASSTSSSSTASPTRVFTWGQGTEGQLGHWPFEKNNLTGAYVELVPRELLLKATGPGASHNSLDLVHVACGVNYTAAVTQDGKVRAVAVRWSKIQRSFTTFNS